MSNLQRILRYRPEAEEAELDLLRFRVEARLASLNGLEADDPPTSEDEPAVANPVGQWLLVAPMEDDAGGSEDDPPAEVVQAAETRAIEPDVEVASAADPAVVEAGPPVQPSLFAIDEDPTREAPVAGEPLVIEDDPPAQVVQAAETGAIEPDVEVAPRPPRAGRPARAVVARPRPVDELEDATRISTGPVPVETTAYCPYCASLLQPPPEANRRCSRCRQKIIVRHVGARTVYLAEAALPFFEAERRRVMDLERWARERDRWLDLARESGAAPDRVRHSAREVPSKAAVAAARALYMSTVDRSFQIAKGDGRWEEAARIRYDQALVLFRIAGSASPPSEEVVKLHREGVAVDLHEIAEVSKDAELGGASCCETCRVDEGRVVRIAEELHSPRLPHRGCPEGLCRCHWFLSARDQEALSEFLRRQARDRRRLTDPATDQAQGDSVSGTA